MLRESHEFGKVADQHLKKDWGQIYAHTLFIIMFPQNKTNRKHSDIIDGCAQKKECNYIYLFVRRYK